MTDPRELPIALPHAALVPSHIGITFDEGAISAHVFEIAFADMRQRGVTPDPRAVLLYRRIRLMAESLGSHSGNDDLASALDVARSGSDRAPVSSMLTSKQVAAELRLSKRRVNQLARSGQLIGHKVGRWMFARGDVERFMDERNGDPGESRT